ncbi:MAG: hypothetical protein LBQ65_01560 [Tannerellaceae bacterium]|jgi:hypothetical protein|nr:hypothetical protein [Tannerellaceae bacterium]
MKKIFYFLTVCVSLSLVFTSCGKDEKEDNILTPAQAVSNLAFTDTDLSELKIGGTLSWQLPESEANIDGYVIYLSGSETTKDSKLGTAPKGATSFTVPEGTSYNIYLLVVAQNTAGESTNIASISISDFSETDEPVTPHDPETMGAFILNRGRSTANNAVLSFYNLAESLMIPDLYQTVNGKGLGDSAEQLLIYGSKTYITVTSSNRLAILDTETGKEINEFRPYGPTDGPLNPRRMAAANGKVYISYYYGHALAELDTASLEIGRTVNVGRYPEHVAFSNGKIYVANSGGLDYPNYGKTVSVINAETFELEKEIEVVINPANLVADSQGDLYLISMGNYGDVPNSLQRIDGQTGEVSTLGKASMFALVNDKLYTVYAQWGDPKVEFKRYDVLTEKVDVDNFITDGTSFTSLSAIGIDPLNGTIYLADSEDYVATGTLYIFSPEGKLESKQETGGSNPIDIVFIGNYDK